MMVKFTSFSSAERRLSTYEEFLDIAINEDTVEGILPDTKAREVRRAYYASITYIDELFGIALDALE